MVRRPDMRATRRDTPKTNIGQSTPFYILHPPRIIERIAAVVYHLELSPEMLDVHEVFHVSQLKQCLRVPEEQAPMEAKDL